MWSKSWSQDYMLQAEVKLHHIVVRVSTDKVYRNLAQILHTIRLSPPLKDKHSWFVFSQNVFPCILKIPYSILFCDLLFFLVAAYWSY